MFYYKLATYYRPRFYADVSVMPFDSNLTRKGPAQARVMMKSVLSSAEHGRCPHKY